VFKEKLNLEQWQSQLISFAFYIAYTVGSLIYYLYSRFTGGDLLNRIGYKNGIAGGLCLSALGTLLFYPAAESASFPLMITGLFIMALGFSLQQTAVNPLTITLGDPKKGSQRLSLAGGINNIGSIIGPLLVNLAIFGTIASSGAHMGSISGVKTPYLILGAAFLVFAIIFKMSSIPDKIEMTHTNDSEEQTVFDKKSVLHYPQLVLGMIGIFVYVGVEVSTAGNLPEFMRQHLHTDTSAIAPYISLYWASLMIGRWTASVDILTASKQARKVLSVLMPFIAFGFFLCINLIAGNNIEPFYNYVFVIVSLIVANVISKGNPARQLFVFSLFGIVALFVGMLSDGLISVYAFISVGLFCSTLWPCIFTLAIAGLGKHTNEGSGLLIMMIMGGGIISLLQGVVAADHLLGIQWSYLAGVACFAYMAFYALRVKSILLKQGIDYDNK
jgi:FHS family L-fucose permease-like MFS transporter